MLKLTSEEQAWLDAYREALDKKHPGKQLKGCSSMDRKRAGRRMPKAIWMYFWSSEIRLPRSKETCDGSVIYSLRKRTSCRLFWRTPKRNGKAGGEADPLSAKRSNATRCVSYEPEHSFSGMASCSRVSASSGDSDPAASMPMQSRELIIVFYTLLRPGYTFMT